MPVEDFAEQQSVEHDRNAATESIEWLLDALISIVKPVGNMLPTGTELVVHDLRKLPNSIIAIAGDLTGRHVGDSGDLNFTAMDPATQLLLESVTRRQVRGLLSYSVQLADGSVMQSQTTIISDQSDLPVLVFCVNSVEPTKEVMRGEPREVAPDRVPHLGRAPEDELMMSNVDDLVGALMKRAISAESVPVSQMKKSHKVRVVERAKAAGIFNLKDSVEFVASTLDVSKFTIYNYLNELDGRAARETASP